MSPLRALAALFLLAIPVVAQAEDWREHVAEGWTASLEIRDASQFDRFYSRLPDPPFVFRLADLMESFFGPLSDRPVVLVVNEPEEQGGVSPFLLLLPIEDFDRFCTKVGAERTEDLAVLRFLGDFAAKPAGEWIAITQLETADLLAAPKSPPPRRCAQSNVVATFSPAGLRLLEEQANRNTPENRRGRRKQPSIPRSMTELFALLGEHAAVWEVLAQQNQTLAIGLSSKDPERLCLTVEWDLPPQENVSPVTPLVLGEEIATLAYSGRVEPGLIDLMLAAFKSSAASLVEASGFPDEAWRAYAEASRSLLRRIESPAVLLTLPGEGEPLGANQSVSFVWDGQTEELGDALLDIVTRWNQLLQATKARSPVSASLAPLGDREGWRIHLDLFGLGEREPLPEEKAVLRRFYGHDRGAQLDVEPIGGGRWLATFAPADNRPDLEAGPALEKAVAAGSLRIDRWIAWDRAQLSAMQDAKKRADPVPPAPAAELRLSTRDNRLLLEAELPWEALLRVYSSKGR